MTTKAANPFSATHISPERAAERERLARSEAWSAAVFRAQQTIDDLHHMHMQQARTTYFEAVWECTELHRKLGEVDAHEAHAVRRLLWAIPSAMVLPTIERVEAATKQARKLAVEFRDRLKAATARAAEREAAE